MYRQHFHLIRFRSCSFLRPKFRVAHTKHDVISILMNEYTCINMYIIKKNNILYIHFLLRYNSFIKA